MRACQLVDPAARLHLEGVILEQEQRTSGEIVVVVVSACDEYGSAGWRLAALAAALAFFGVHAFAPSWPWWSLLLAQALAAALAHGAARAAKLRRLLLPDDLVERRVAERARRAFFEVGLADTAGRTGILILVSALERRVVVLGDTGIDRALGAGESWQEVVDRAVDGLRRGRAVEGIEAAIRRCGEILAAHVPPGARNLNELPDAIVVVED